jgi:hypothetical protein
MTQLKSRPFSGEILLQVTSFDNFGFHDLDEAGELSNNFEFLSHPDIVFPLGVERKSKSGDTYVRVLSTLGVVWIGKWCLGYVKGDFDE